MKIKQPTVDGIIAINKYVCQRGGNPHQLYDGVKLKVR